MLSDPARFYNSPTFGLIAGLNGNATERTRIASGIYQIGHFSADILVYGRNGGWGFEPPNDIPSHGVCDSIEQFQGKFSEALEADPRKLAVFFTHVKKNPGEKDGWRWHKWGEYIGDGSPEREYLADEKGFDSGVYVFSILDIENP